MKLFQKIEALLAIGLLIAFFLPWAKYFVFSISAYDVALNIGSFNQLGLKPNDAHLGKLLWLLPALAANVLYRAHFNQKLGTAAQMAGVFPFIVLGVAYLKIGKDIFEVLTIGAYLSVALGAALILYGSGRLKSPAASSENPKGEAGT